MQVGLGILLGVFIMSWIADRYGRRPAILTATFLGGLCIWPFAYVTNFPGMVALSVLSTLGVGGIVATHSVYLSEMTSPELRNRVLLTSQGVTALVAVGVNLLAFFPYSAPVARSSCGSAPGSRSSSCCRCSTGSCRNRRVGWKRTGGMRKPSGSWRTSRRAVRQRSGRHFRNRTLAEIPWSPLPIVPGPNCLPARCTDAGPGSSSPSGCWRMRG